MQGFSPSDLMISTALGCAQAQFSPLVIKYLNELVRLHLGGYNF